MQSNQLITILMYSYNTECLQLATSCCPRVLLQRAMIKAPRGDANTARCSKVEPKTFAPPQTPFPGAQDGQNLIIWRWSLPLSMQTQFGEDRCTQFRVILVTDPPTHRQYRLQYTASQLASSLIRASLNTARFVLHVSVAALNMDKLSQTMSYF